MNTCLVLFEFHGSCEFHKEIQRFEKLQSKLNLNLIENVKISPNADITENWIVFYNPKTRNFEMKRESGVNYATVIRYRCKDANGFLAFDSRRSRRETRFSLKYAMRSIPVIELNNKFKVKAIGSPDMSIVLQEMDKCIQVYENTHSEDISSLAFSPQFDLLVSSAGGNIKVWKVFIGQLTVKLTMQFEITSPFHAKIKDMKYLDSKSQALLLVGDEEGNLILVNLLKQVITWKQAKVYPDAVYFIE